MTKTIPEKWEILVSVNDTDDIIDNELIFNNVEIGDSVTLEKVLHKEKKRQC